MNLIEKKRRCLKDLNEERNIDEIDLIKYAEKQKDAIKRVFSAIKS